MPKMTAVGIVGVVLMTTVLMAQRVQQPLGEGGGTAATPFFILWPPSGLVPAVGRGASTTLHGTIVELTCFRKMGAGTIASPEQIACAKAAVAAKSGVVGILTDGDGVFKLVGNLTTNNYVNLVPLLGQRVVMPGSEVILSNNFDYHAYEGRSLTVEKK